MIRLTQLLCPNRHCIVAAAYDDRDPAAFPQRMIETQLDANVIERLCGLCGATDLHFEDRSTAFKTMDEALPTLRLVEAANIESRRRIEMLKANKN